VAIRRPAAVDCDDFVTLALASREFHHPWVDPAKTREAFYGYVRSRHTATDDGFVVCEMTAGSIIGVINLNCIVRNMFQSAYLGFYAFANTSGRGLMTEGLNLVVQYAFNEMGLHRLEANIQPKNVKSIALAERCGFKKEGFSPKYLKVYGEWRDHERWAIINDRAL